MPKVGRIRKNCKIEVEWLEPESDKGRRSTVLAKKIVSFEKGLKIEQTVLCSWGSRKYKAVVKSIEARVSGPECAEQSIPPKRPTVTEEVLPSPDHVTSVTSCPNSSGTAELINDTATPCAQSPPVVPSFTNLNTISTQTVSIDVSFVTSPPTFPDDATRPHAQAVPVSSNSMAVQTESSANINSSFKLTSGTQTECFYATHETVTAMQQQLQNLAESNAVLTAHIKTIMDFIGRAHVQVPASPSSPFTPPRSSPLRSQTSDPRYGKLINGKVRLQVDQGSVPFVEIPKISYDKAFYNAKTASSFTRQLLRFVYTNEEITGSNFEGGEVLTASGFIVKPMLERARMSALLSQVELEFPGSTLGKTSMCKLRDSVNECCRQEARKKLKL